MKENLTTLVVAFISVLTLFLQQNVNANQSSLLEENSLKKYYHFLESIATQPRNQQITALKEYLEQNGDFEQIYFKLIETSLLENKLDSIKMYFELHSKSSNFRSNCFWALAKINELQNNRTAAFSMFIEAIEIGSVSPVLFIDFVEFSIANESKFAWQDSISRLNLNPDVIALIEALKSFFNPSQGNSDSAFDVIEKALLKQPQIYHLGGTYFYNQARYFQADSLWKIGLSEAQKQHDWQAEAQLLTSLALLANEIDTSLAYYARAEEIARKIGDYNRLQFILGSRANLRETNDETIADFQEAIEITEQLKSFNDAAYWYMGLAQALFTAERFSQALEANEKGLAMADLARDTNALVQLTRDKGDYYFDLHLDSLARKVYQDVYDLAKSTNLLWQKKSAKARLADYLLEEKKYDEAREAYFEYIEFLPQNADFDLRAYWLGRVADSFRKEKRFDLARNWLARAIETARMGGVDFYANWLMLELAKLDVFENKPKDAIAKCDSILIYSQQEYLDDLQWQTLLVLSCAHQLLGHLAPAISSLKTAARLIENTRYNLSVAQIQISFFSEAQQVYRQLVTCYLKRYQATGKTTDLDTLFYYTQLTRGRTMHELAARRRSGQTAISYDDEYWQRRLSLRHIQRRIRERPNLRNAMRTELEAARLALVTKRLRLSNSLARSDSTTDSEAQWLSPVVENLKKQNTGLLLYHLAEDTSFVFVIANDSTQIIGLDVTPDALYTSVSELMSPFHEVKSDSVQFVSFRADIAYKLYETLVQPVELALDDLPTNLLIVPDIEIMQLPFEMLLTEKQKKTEYTPLDEPEYARDFLLHRYTISYSPSLAFLQMPSHKSANSPSLLILANPFSPQITHASTTRSQRGWRFDALPYAEIEANAIHQKHAGQAKLFLRGGATKARFFQMAGEHQIIHFATHAFADNAFDAFSGLVLAATSDSTDDGILMGYEIADLQLQAELVALSACETGRGRVVSGEGVLGLPRLFLGAGAKSVLMTRWLIDDEFSSQMLPKFYEFCLDQDFSKAEALSEAKRSVFGKISRSAENRYQHPFYWASYSLYGHPGKILYTDWQTLLIYFTALLFICSLLIFIGYRWYKTTHS